MRFFRRSMVGLFLMAVTLGLLSLAGGLVFRAVTAASGDENAENGAQERVFSARVIAVSAGTITPELTAYGEIGDRP